MQLCESIDVTAGGDEVRMCVCVYVCQWGGGGVGGVMYIK